jgi:hypothetical protein
MEEQDRGFAATGRFICQQCVSDEALRAVVVDRAYAEDEGSYCRTAPAASFDDVLGHMLNALRYEYRPASEESPPYDSGQGGYQAREYDLPDLLFGGLDGDFDPPQVYQDILEAISPYLEPWFDRDWYALRPHEQVLASWQRFATLLVRRREFVLRPRPRRARDPDEPIDPEEMLDALGRVISGVPGVYRTLTTRRPLWRARYGPERGWRTAEDLGPPPSSTDAAAGRMNVRGETLFCGAIEPETAVVEKFRSGERRALSVGPFFPLRPLHVLDLTASRLPIPGIHSVGQHRIRTASMFLHEFAREIAKAVLRAESPRYLPTQIVRAYVRTELSAVTGMAADGIAFASSRCPGTNIVLFVDSGGCVDRGAPVTGSHLLALHGRLVAALTAAQTRRRWHAVVGGRAGR